VHCIAIDLYFILSTTKVHTHTPVRGRINTLGNIPTETKERKRERERGSWRKQVKVEYTLSLSRPTIILWVWIVENVGRECNGRMNPFVDLSVIIMAELGGDWGSQISCELAHYGPGTLGPSRSSCAHWSPKTRFVRSILPSHSFTSAQKTK